MSSPTPPFNNNDDSTDLFAANQQPSGNEHQPLSNQPARSAGGKLPRGVIIGGIVVVGLIATAVLWPKPTPEVKPEEGQQEQALTYRQLSDMVAASKTNLADVEPYAVFQWERDVRGVLDESIPQRIEDFRYDPTQYLYLPGVVSLSEHDAQKLIFSLKRSFQT